MGDETYNGYANRETWTLCLWIDNDEGLSSMFRELAGEGGEPWEVQDRIRDAVTTLLNPSDYRDAYGVEQPDGIRSMVFEVGSLWRIDWREVADNLTEF